jgi:hypothetical protein
MCTGSGIILSEGERYRITIKQLGEWRDKRIPTDLGGFAGLPALATVKIPALGLVVAGGCLVSLVRTIRAKDRAPLDQTIFFLTAFSLLFAITTAIGRVCLAVSTGSSTRYIPYILPSFLGMYFALLSWKLPSTTRAALLSVFVVIAAGGHGARGDLYQRRSRQRQVLGPPPDRPGADAAQSR